tara:strand:+ start:89 stop:220 length:132 start_codon:yes stop_codon:yes gene_type:complete
MKTEYSKKKLCSTKRFNKYILLKNPMNGGTPAKEKRKTVRKNR